MGVQGVQKPIPLGVSEQVRQRDRPVPHDVQETQVHQHQEGRREAVARHKVRLQQRSARLQRDPNLHRRAGPRLVLPLLACEMRGFCPVQNQVCAQRDCQARSRVSQHPGAVHLLPN